MRSVRIEAGALRAQAAGRWPEVLAVLAPALMPALERLGRHGPCPVHGGRDGFRLFRDVLETGGGICNSCGTFPDGFALLMWVNHWSFPQALQAVAQALGGSPDGVPPRSWNCRTYASAAERDRKALIEALARVWAQSLDPADRRAGPLRAYLRRRGLDGTPLDAAVVRFHPALGYWERTDDGEWALRGRYPALVARVRGADGSPVTLLRTYLTPDGRKAPVAAPKKLMAHPGDRLGGGAIRLFAPAPVLGVAEGIETALAVQRQTGMPVWSAVSATLLARFEPPAATRRVLVWADRDRSGAGAAAALALRERLLGRGIAVVVRLPPGPIPAGAKGLDWADVWGDRPQPAAA
ncbi:DUF7146 domain-containing protein [Thiococcus pfennigii]|uniref:DUF7146 domain-containing protein n=1 Tax=Thiococcus pfennigii TaxID=1057 RepID=UPI0019086D51|nr:toprim domain-containing protein [Thiococcus pfennigii]MBK1699951.1 zinc-binding protein [Thiococcus pfennigii]